MTGIAGCVHDECQLAANHEGPHDTGQGAIDWAAAERAALQEEGEEPTTPTEAAAAASMPDEKRPTVEIPLDPRAGGITALPAPEPLTPTLSAPAARTRLQTMRDMLEKTLPRVMNVIPRNVSPERLFAVVHVALERNPDLLECTSISILRGVIIGAQLGLDVSGVGGMAYLVPYRNKRTGQKEAQFIPGYRGLIELARRSGEVAWITPNIVCQNDPEFSYTVDPIPRIKHHPLLDREARGPIVGAYAIAIFRDQGIPPFPWAISKVEVDRARARSQAKTGPWVTDYEAMAMKTAIRGITKYLPWSPDLARAMDAEDRAEAGETITLPGELPEGPADLPPEAPATVQTGGASEVIAKKLAGRRKKQPA